ncbi:MAG: hypothetical protein HY560_03190, partial [Gemmatimonadetes bacterium]|nr:hypothetical protein [Gemmatimonadota bacterium]
MTARLIIGMALLLAACAGDPTALDVPAAALNRHPGHAPGTAQVSAGERHSCAAARTPLAHCWGDNSFLQLGRTGPN